uniref:Uncharacterized protein n=1 Tax=Globodera rostochiensis TaxID=31243 RepID=A0A914H0Q4_GLORO
MPAPIHAKPSVPTNLLLMLVLLPCLRCPTHPQRRFVAFVKLSDPKFCSQALPPSNIHPIAECATDSASPPSPAPRPPYSTMTIRSSSSSSCSFLPLSSLLHRGFVVLCALSVLQFKPSLTTAAAVFAESGPASSSVDQFVHSDCAQLAGGDEERLLLCQLYESSALLAQLGVLVNEGIGRLAVSQGMGNKFIVADGGREKRKHEYLRFGKRKHEYLRFGRK